MYHHFVMLTADRRPLGLKQIDLLPSANHFPVFFHDILMLCLQSTQDLTCDELNFLRTFFNQFVAQFEAVNLLGGF